MKDKSELGEQKREVKVTPFILDAFDLLKENADQKKITGGLKIISQLQKNEDEKSVKYVLKRLVRSVGANVPEQRISYFATLVAILNQIDNITVDSLLNLVKKELHASGSSKSEVGDVALGQILVCGAIFRSGLIKKCTEEEQKQVVQLLITASKKKSYLSTVAYVVLVDFVKTLEADQFTSIVWKNVKVELKKDLKEYDLDSLYFLMVASTKFPEKVKLTKLLGVSELLCEDNIHVICEKLMSGVDFNSISHPIYKEIGTRIAKSPHLELFWVSGIDSQLVKHNRNRELVSINLLNTILQNLQDNIDIIPELISRNFFKLFMDWFKGLQTASKIRNKNDNEDDHKIMIKKERELLTTLANTLKGKNVNNEIRISVLKKLLFNPGEINFTEITGSCIIKSLLADLDISGVKKMGKLFKGVLLSTSKKIVKEDTERNWYNNERVKAAELISFLVNHEAVKDDTEFKLGFMKQLMYFGFFKITVDDNIAISNQLSVHIKTCFYRCVTSKFSKVDTLVSLLSSLCEFISEILEKEQIRTKLEKQFPKENMECWNMVTEICQSIEKTETKTKVDKVFLILLYQLGLFLFSEPVHVKIARSSIKELKSCYIHYKKNKKKSKKMTEDELAEGEPEWMEVLIEVLLSILSAESVVLRSVVQCVFRLLCDNITPSSMNQIVSVLDPENEANPLTQDSESEGDESGDDPEVEESDKEKSDDDKDESDSEIENDNDDEELKTPEQLRLAVQQALAVTGPDSDNESLDADMIDEEEGKKLDNALAEAFKQFHHGKGKASKRERKNKKALSDFRTRVLDLIDIYLEKDPAMEVCLEMIAPLTRCLEFCIQDNQYRELETRINKTIKQFSKIRQFSSTDNVTVEILSDYLATIIDKGARSHFVYQALGNTMTQFTIFIIHCRQKLNLKKKKSTKFLEIFTNALNNHFANRNSLLPQTFFTKILEMDWDGNFDLLDIIVENVFNSDVRNFRRTEGILLLTGFYRALNRSKPTQEKLQDKLTSVENKFEKSLLKTFSEQSDITIKPKYITMLKTLLNTVKLFHDNCKVPTPLNFQSVMGAVCAFKVSKVKKQNTDVENGKQSDKLENKKQENEQVVQQFRKKNKQKNKKRKHDQINGTNGLNVKKMRKESSQSE